MNKNLIKALFISAAFMISTMSLFAGEAKVTYVKGKVEISKNGEWIPLNVGDVILQSDMINTGFQSEARVNINGSVMAVPAMTRVTLETLSTSDTKDSVSLYVSTGAVRSKVTHTDNKKIEYTARTSVAVASVRGTDFTITAKGRVSCREGAVAVYSAKQYKAPEVAAEETKEEESAEEGEATSEVAETTATETGTSETEGAATATTAANDIASDAPAGAVVVGAGQATEFSSSGTPQKPATDASQKTEKVKSQVSTQAEKSAENTDTSSNTPVIIEPAKPKTGSLEVKIVLED